MQTPDERKGASPLTGKQTRTPVRPLKEHSSYIALLNAKRMLEHHGNALDVVETSCTIYHW
jgi:hypothetical protein